MRIRIATAIACLLLPLGAAAQLVGSEFQINSHTVSGQNFPALAAAADGAFVVVWASYLQDGSSYGIFGQRFDSAGQSNGSEFQVNSYTNIYQFWPGVAAGADGAFVVAWQSYQGPGGYEVFAQRYDNAGQPAGTEFQVNSYTPGYQNLPAVAAGTDGAFVVAWLSEARDGDGSGIFGQRYDSAGQATGAEFQVNSYTLSYQFFPALAVAGNGSVIMTWESYSVGLPQDGSNSGVFGQRYDSSGQAVGSEFLVNAYTQDRQSHPAVAAAPDGSFVVTWDSYRDGDIAGVFARRFDSSGGATGTEFQVNGFTLSFQNNPAVAMGADGSFVVTWDGYHNGSGTDVFGQHYDSAGLAIGVEFQINTYTTTFQTSSAVVPGAAGTFTVVWRSRGEDGDYNGVFGQRIEPTPSVVDDGCPAAPSGTCVDSLKAQLQLKLSTSDTKDKLKWKFSGGPLLGQGDFGDPITTATYALCIYDDGALAAELEVGPSNTLWAPVSNKGYQYKDPNGTADGVTKLKLLGGDAGKSKLQLKGKGSDLPMPTPVSGTRFFAQNSAVVAQLREANGDCYESVFTDAETSKNDGVQYKAKK